MGERTRKCLKNLPVLYADGPIEKQRLNPYAWPGGYTIAYLVIQNGIEDCLCARCADYYVEFTEDGPFTRYPDTDVSFYINYEEPDLYCEECNKHLEAAYVTDEEDPANES